MSVVVAANRNPVAHDGLPCRSAVFGISPYGQEASLQRRLLWSSCGDRWLILADLGELTAAILNGSPV